MIMLAIAFPIAKGIIMKIAESEQVKRLVVEILKRIVSRTDNDLDDLVVANIEMALFPPAKEEG
jgi:hypothetical protein